MAKTYIPRGSFL